ncbi:flagellar protein FlaG [Clostridium butyricum]|uniref:flagellar protein FlaG n=1 Tax=Clostridium butyricum TaxID=1492 RepID=UPI0013D52372|nr:flagellar protein FlaG [Clostridium butyricum]MCQ2022259.1 flagellar protein FlaG [Clostridium butyricum]NFB70124.1 flagellar protein FlaG [Clostridium butyricum]NFB89911.1 flagellar protein FlaG [Clostridium butyricum]
MDVRLNNEYHDYMNSYTAKENGSLSTKVKNNEAGVSKVKNIEEYSKQDLNRSINKLNKFLEDDKTHAEFSKHKDLGTLMVKIVDDENDKVLLELPPEKVLDMVASLCKQVGILDEKA